MMQLEDYFNFLTPNDIRLKGTRIGIETILYDYIYHAKWVGGIKYKMNVNPNREVWESPSVLRQ